VTRTLKIIPAIVVLLTTVSLAAQDAVQPPPNPRTAEPVSLKVSLVFARYQGDKRISSVPPVLWVTANQNRTSLRMGTQIPVPSTVFSKEGAASQSYSYKDVGTNIDCSATTASGGFFKLVLTVEDSSVYFPDQSEAAAKFATTGAPAFRSFTSTFTLFLRDGQTAQSTSATDPVSGQVTKLDATVNVQK
jgi:type II secretory pathway component GspD/PulD (secretin)